MHTEALISRTYIRQNRLVAVARLVATFALLIVIVNDLDGPKYGQEVWQRIPDSTINPYMFDPPVSCVTLRFCRRKTTTLAKMPDGARRVSRVRYCVNCDAESANSIIASMIAIESVHARARSCARVQERCRLPEATA